MALEQHDLDEIERLIYKNADDMAVSLARSFERLEEQMAASEHRVHESLEHIERVIRHSGANRFDEPEDED